MLSLKGLPSTRWALLGAIVLVSPMALATALSAIENLDLSRL